MSGSRGEANFVWKCKNCKVRRISPLQSSGAYVFGNQRESSASIQAAPISYERSEPPKAQKILEFDCRGLEFTEFKPEVGCMISESQKRASYLECTGRVASGRRRVKDTFRLDRPY
jgi:hypothetical protein